MGQNLEAGKARLDTPPSPKRIPFTVQAAAEYPDTAQPSILGMTMADEPDKTLDEQAAFIAALYGHPVSRETSRLGNWLVIAAFVELAVVLFGATLEPSSAWPIKFPAGTNALPKLLSWAIAGLLIVYLPRALMDFAKTRETGRLIVSYVQSQKTKIAFAQATAEQEALNGEHYEYGSYPMGNAYITKDVANDTIWRAQESLGLRRFPTILRTIRIIIELGGPFAVGVGVLLYIFCVKGHAYLF